MATRTLTRDGLHVYLYNAATGGTWECPIDFEATSLTNGWVYAAGPPGYVKPGTAAYTYNADGSVATETSGSTVTAYTYNADGSVATATTNGATLTYSYDASGNVTAVS